MAIGVPTTLAASSNGMATNVYTTFGTVAAGANDTVLGFIFSNEGAGASAAPTSITGQALTFSKVAEFKNSTQGINGKIDISVWKGIGTPTSGNFTINYSTNMVNIAWHFIGLTGVDEANPIVQTKTTETLGTTLAVTLDNAVGAGNATFGLGAVQTSGATVTGGAGYTVIATPNPSGLRSMSEYRLDGQTLIDFSVTGSVAKMLLGFELKSDSPAPPSDDWTYHKFIRLGI